jgi:hypothetical protein
VIFNSFSVFMAYSLLDSVCGRARPPLTVTAIVVSFVRLPIIGYDFDKAE